ncbi:MAG: hypothetical protein ACI9S9_003821 [Planctomycetota bacterium]|jgi:hypothetical protein
MRLFALVVLATAAVTQSPMATTYNSNNTGAVGGAIYFDLTAVTGGGVLISDIDLSVSGSTGGFAVTMDVYTAPMGAAHTSTMWSLVSGGTCAATLPQHCRKVRRHRSPCRRRSNSVTAARSLSPWLHKGSRTPTQLAPVCRCHTRLVN